LSHGCGESYKDPRAQNRANNRDKYCIVAHENIDEKWVLVKNSITEKKTGNIST
jgi:hypothetical protein